MYWESSSRFAGNILAAQHTYRASFLCGIFLKVLFDILGVMTARIRLYVKSCTSSSQKVLRDLRGHCLTFSDLQKTDCS